jgi:hypothetical protein
VSHHSTVYTVGVLHTRASLSYAQSLSVQQLVLVMFMLTHMMQLLCLLVLFVIEHCYIGRRVGAWLSTASTYG